MKILVEAAKGARPNEGKWEDVALVIKTTTERKSKAYTYNQTRLMYEAEAKNIHDFLIEYLPSGTYTVLRTLFFHESLIPENCEEEEEK